MAGLAVDTVMHPIDTIKTRQQLIRGGGSFFPSRMLYSGIGAVALGSAPSAAIFWAVYGQLLGVHPLLASISGTRNPCIPTLV